MIGSAQSAHLVDSVILSRHTACLAPPNVAILRMYTSSESHFLLPAKRLALRMGRGGGGRQRVRPNFFSYRAFFAQFLPIRSI